MLPGLFKPLMSAPLYPRPEGGRSSAKDIPFVVPTLSIGIASFALPGENSIEHPDQGLKSPGYDHAPSGRKMPLRGTRVQAAST